MRSSVHVTATVEALLGHPVAALSERLAPRLTRLLVNLTVERSLWPVDMLLGGDATVAYIAPAAIAYAAEGRRPPLPRRNSGPGGEGGGLGLSQLLPLRPQVDAEIRSSSASSLITAMSYV